MQPGFRCSHLVSYPTKPQIRWTDTEPDTGPFEDGMDGDRVRTGNQLKRPVKRIAIDHVWNDCSRGSR